MPHDHVDALVISGNAVRKNPAFRRMLKDVFHMNVRMPLHKEEAAFGAAMFSAMTAGIADRSTLAACIRYSEL
jgi:sedoheptulokinase